MKIRFLERFVMRWNKRRYRKAMMNAISFAAQNPWNDDKPASKTDGLRVIHSFERVNKTKFNPFDGCHVELVAGHGKDESFFRALRLKGILA